MVADDTVLSGLGYHSVELIGAGAEANVYAISDNKVLRLLKTEDELSNLEKHVALLSEIHIASSHCAFETPQIESIVSYEDRYETIEKRLPGCSMSTELSKASGTYRTELMHAWLNASLEISSIDIGESLFGDIGRINSPGYDSFYNYWTRRLEESLCSRGGIYEYVDVKYIATSMPEPNEPRLVHLDLYSDNLLWYRGKISSILDFGFCTVAGDAKLSPLFAAVYAMHFAESPDENDESIIRGWLRDNSLLIYLDRARMMMAAYWSFVDDDPEMEEWCRQSLLTDGPS